MRWLWPPALDLARLEQANAVQRDLWVQEALATAAIEGEQLNLESLRSSVAHRLALADAPSADRSVDGLVQVMQDALVNHSGAPGREVVHYEVPPSAQVATEMDSFLAWFANTRPTGAATASTRGATVNGIARAALAQDMHAFDPQASPALVRVYGLDQQMRKTRAGYYDALNHAQHLRGIAPEASTIDATPWVQWFVQAFTRACITSQAVVRDATDKAQFRLQAAQCHINPRQSKVLERLLEAGHVGSGGDFLGGMTSDKYAKITATSKATATRDLTDLLVHGLLRVEGLGKATRYVVNVPGWEQPAVKS